MPSGRHFIDLENAGIRASILEGDIDKALKLTSAFYPAVLNKNENIYFKLKCRKFIEMIRRCTELQSAPSAKRSGTQNGQMDNYDDVFDHQMELDDQMQGHNDWERMDTEDADLHAKQGDLLNQTLKFGQELKSEFQNDPRREVKKALEDTFALIAYTDARESSLAPLLEISGRAPVAEELNSAILSESFILPSSPLVCRMLTPRSLSRQVIFSRS